MPSRPDHPLESPWFWLLVFSLMALVAVVLIGPKYMRRQARLEQKLEGRVRAQQPLETRPAEVQLGERGGGENDIVTIAPLASFLGILAAVAWFQWTRERARWLKHQRGIAVTGQPNEKAERAP